MMNVNSGVANFLKKKHLKQLAEYRDNVLRVSPKLHSLFLELTINCNEFCRHCGSNCGERHEENALSLEEYKRILDQVKEDFDISNLRLCITGGEPLLRKDFFEIVNYAKEIGFTWGMTSNGILITKEVAKKLRDAGMQTISISVDGLKETHEWFRRVPGSYDKAISGVKNLLEEGGFKHVQITTVVHHRNYHELEAMYEEFSKLGIKSWRVINIEPIGRAKDDSELMLTKEEYKGLFDFIEDKRFKGDMQVTYGCSHFLGVKREREVRKWYFLCNAGVHTASITYNGDVTGCLDIERRPELVQGNVRNERFKDIWFREFKVFRSDYRKTGKCEKCKDYKYCAGDSFHTWNFDTMEPNLCMRDMLK